MVISVSLSRKAALLAGGTAGSAMKKLLGGLFQRHASQPASPPKDEGSARASPAAGPAGSSSAGSTGALRAKDHNWIYRTGPRGSWGSFFGASASATVSARAPAVSAVPTPPKVFRQNLDVLLKEVACRMKAMCVDLSLSICGLEVLTRPCGDISSGSPRCRTGWRSRVRWTIC